MRSSPLGEDVLDRIAGGRRWALRIWEPREVLVVLGRSNRGECEVRLPVCSADGVPVLRRRGGGGAVVLAPGCLALSLAVAVPRGLRVGPPMEAAARALAEMLAEVTGLPLEVRGLGDTCLGTRKIAGSSAFRGREAFLYQASVLVSMDLGLVERYLHHPSREPDYRGGRSHRSFLTTLGASGFSGSMSDLAGALKRGMAECWEDIRTAGGWSGVDSARASPDGRRAGGR